MPLIVQRITRLWARLLGHGFIANVAVLVGATALAQGLTILISPVLTRLYSPADFGIFTVYTAVLGTVAVIACLRYELAVPLPEDDKVAARVLVLCLWVSVAMGLAVGLAAWFFGGSFVELIKAPQLRPYLWLLPPGVVLSGIYSALNRWGQRRHAFKLIARTKMNQGVASVITQVGLGLLGWKPLGLLIGGIVSSSAGSGSLLRYMWAEDRNAFAAMRFKDLCSVAHRYRNFPIVSTWAALLNGFAVSLPPLLMAVFYGTETVGQLGLATRVIWLPVSLVSAAVCQVLFARLANIVQAGNYEAVSGLVSKVARQLFWVSLVPTAIIAIGGPWLFAKVFGNTWTEGGQYAQMLAGASLIQFVASPTGVVLDVLERQDLHLIRELFRTIIVAVAIAVCGTHKASPSVTIAWMSLAIGVGYASFFGFSWHAVRKAQSGARQLADDLSDHGSRP